MNSKYEKLPKLHAGNLLDEDSESLDSPTSAKVLKFVFSSF